MSSSTTRGRGACGSSCQRYGEPVALDTAHIIGRMFDEIAADIFGSVDWYVDDWAAGSSVTIDWGPLGHPTRRLGRHRGWHLSVPSQRRPTAVPTVSQLAAACGWSCAAMAVAVRTKAATAAEREIRGQATTRVAGPRSVTGR